MTRPKRPLTLRGHAKPQGSMTSSPGPSGRGCQIASVAGVHGDWRRRRPRNVSRFFPGDRIQTPRPTDSLILTSTSKTGES